MKIILSLTCCLFLASCAGFQKYEPLVQPAATIVVKNIIDKNPNKVKDFVLLANGLDLLSKGINRELALIDFIDLTDKFDQDREWAIIASTLYNIYKSKLDESGNIQNSNRIIQYISYGIRDAILIVSVSK